MLALVGVLLIVIWLVGLVTHSAGAFIHLVLVLALVMFVSHLLRDR